MTRTTQAVQLLELLHGPAGIPDPLGRTILLTAAALLGLLSAAAIMRDSRRGDGDTAAVARCVGHAITVLGQAAQDAENQRVLADPLSLTDYQNAEA